MWAEIRIWHLLFTSSKSVLSHELQARKTISSRTISESLTTRWSASSTFLQYITILCSDTHIFSQYKCSNKVPNPKMENGLLSISKFSVEVLPWVCKLRIFNRDNIGEGTTRGWSVLSADSQASFNKNQHGFICHSGIGLALTIGTSFYYNSQFISFFIFETSIYFLSCDKLNFSDFLLINKICESSQLAKSHKLPFNRSKFISFVCFEHYTLWYMGTYSSCFFWRFSIFYFLWMIIGVLLGYILWGFNLMHWLPFNTLSIWQKICSLWLLRNPTNNSRFL